MSVDKATLMVGQQLRTTDTEEVYHNFAPGTLVAVLPDDDDRVQQAHDATAIFFGLEKANRLTAYLVHVEDQEGWVQSIRPEDLEPA